MRLRTKTKTSNPRSCGLEDLRAKTRSADALKVRKQPIRYREGIERSKGKKPLTSHKYSAKILKYKNSILILKFNKQCTRDL